MQRRADRRKTQTGLDPGVALRSGLREVRPRSSRGHRAGDLGAGRQRPSVVRPGFVKRTGQGQGKNIMSRNPLSLKLPLTRGCLPKAPQGSFTL
jgi:hypothetical protein